MSEEVQAKRGRGRPKGSTNKNKTSDEVATPEGKLRAKDAWKFTLALTKRAQQLTS